MYVPLLPSSCAVCLICCVHPPEPQQSCTASILCYDKSKLAHGCRGWLLRLLNSVQDQDDFNRLDQMLVNALEAAEVDTSQQPLVELKNPRSYAPQQQQLEAALKNLGGIAKLLRDPLSATIRLQSLLHQLPSGSNIDFILQQEIDHYLSSHLWFSSISSRPGSQENSFNRLGSAGSNGSNGLNRGSSGGSGSGMLRRTSSLGARARPTLSVVEPFMVLRNDTVRTEWRQAFGGRERVTWREFWSKMVQPAVSCRHHCQPQLLQV